MKTPEWWCDLHQRAIERISTDWVSMREFTDRPEVCRDLLQAGLIQVRNMPTRLGGTCKYRLTDGRPFNGSQKREVTP